MMGQKKEQQAALFYEFCLEDHVPQDHLLRSVDRFVDLGDIRRYLAPFYSDIGRPSIDPELMIRMLLVGYIIGIRSERWLCDEVHVNLAYRWFCRLDLGDAVPDQSTFSKNRHGRFRESDLFRQLFESVVARCIKERMVGGEVFATDASIIRADANKQNSTAKDEWDASSIDPSSAPRAVKEYLETLDDAAFGAASEVDPKFTSHCDPTSQWTGAMKGPAFFAYSDNYLIDTDNAIIVDVEASRSIRQAEVGATRTMIVRTRDKFGLYPEILVTVYSNIVEQTQKVISTFLLNRANHIMSNQPDLISFVTGNNTNGGGPLGNLTLTANEASQVLAFSTSRSKILAERDRAIAALTIGENAVPAIDPLAILTGQVEDNSRNLRADSRKQSGRDASFAFGGEATQLLSGADLISDQRHAVPLLDVSRTDNTTGISRTGTWDIWAEIYGAASNSGSSDSSIWVGYLGGHYFVSDHTLVGILGQIDWAD